MNIIPENKIWDSTSWIFKNLYESTWAEDRLGLIRRWWAARASSLFRRVFSYIIYNHCTSREFLNSNRPKTGTSFRRRFGPEKAEGRSGPFAPEGPKPSVDFAKGEARGRPARGVGEGRWLRRAGAFREPSLREPERAPAPARSADGRTAFSVEAPFGSVCGMQEAQH